MARIVVVGSSNTDMVVAAERIPAPGETVIGGDFAMVGGGKGANQAISAARLGADVTFVARVGSDVFGDSALQAFRDAGMCVDFVTRDEVAPSGVALILVDRSGENVIAVAPGANGQLLPEHVLEAEAVFHGADAVLLQLEIPVESVSAAAKLAKSCGARVILNPAPASDLPPDLLSMVDVLTPNETEAALLSGGDGDPETLASRLLEMGPRCVVMTLGSSGALVATPDVSEHVPAPRVNAVDSTAAGDAFNGALAVGLCEGMDLAAAVRFAVKAAAISVTRRGAQPSLPSRQEVEAFAESPRS